MNAFRAFAARLVLVLGCCACGGTESARPLTVAAEFANTGNVQLVVTGEVQVIAQTGDVVRSFPFAEHGRDYFRVLPGTERTVEIIDLSGESALSEGIYQAVVSFDFGGESVVVGARGFRIR